jgi:CRISPR-associated protein Cmr1
MGVISVETLMKPVTRRPEAPGQFARRDQDAGIATRDWELSLLTPMLGGSAAKGSANGSAPLRLSELKHQLRFWWRALQPTTISPAELRTKETAIFGGAASAANEGGGSEGAIASRVTLRMIEQAAATVMTASKEDFRDCPQYGLGPLMQDRNQTVGLIKAGWKCKVRIETLELSTEQQQQVDDAWRAALFFGGVGARTRRGFGSLSCAAMHTDTEWQKLLASFKRVSAEAPPMAAWPSLHSCRLWTRETTATDAVAGWRQLIEAMGEFRQGRRIGRAPGSNGRPGRSYWPEPDAVRSWLPFTSLQHPVEHPAAMNGGWFPRTAYGLPLGIRFKQNGNKDPNGTALITPDDRERWPSPIILKAIRFHSGSIWHVCLWLNHRTPDLSIKWSTDRVDGFPAGKGPDRLPRTAGPDDFAHKVMRKLPGAAPASIHPVEALADHLKLTILT